MADINPYLDIIKNASSGDSVRDAIINCMNEINKDTAFTVTDKVISGKISEINNGSPYTAPSGQVWKHVTLNIQDDSGEDYPASNVKVVDFEVNDYTENGEYTAGENEKYGTITVNVSHAGEWEGIVDNVAISTLDLDSSSTYHASTQGYTAVKSITFTNVDSAAARGGYRDSIDGKNKFPCRFFDSSNQEVYSEAVVERTSANYKGPTPPDAYHIGVWTGWDKPTNNITSATDFYPTYDDGSISHDTITDTWVQLKTTGKNWPLGSKKTLDFGNSECKFRGKILNSAIKYSSTEKFYTTAPDGVVNSLHMPMMLVAKGEQGTGTTWLSTIPISFNSVMNMSNNPYNLVNSNTGGSIETRMAFLRVYSSISGWTRDDWQSGWLRQWLNDCLFSAFPDEMKDIIIPCKKYTMGISTKEVETDYAEFKEYSSNDSLWIPSSKELASFFGTYAPSNMESNGIDYSANAGWTPETTEKIYTRTNNTMAYNGYTGVSASLSYVEGEIAVTGSSNECPYMFYLTNSDSRYKLYLGFCL